MALDLSDLLHQLLLFVPKVIAAIIILAGSLVLANFVGRWCHKALGKRIEQDETVRLVARLARWSLIVAGVLASLEQVDFNVTTFLAGLGVAGLTVGFALQDIARNFIAGIILLIRRPFAIGDAVQVAGYSGKVIDVRTRDTTIQTWDGEHVILPNLKVLEEAITDFSVAPRRRRTIRVGLGYDVDIEYAIEVLLTALGEVEGVLDDPGPMAHAETMGDFSVVVALRFWLDPNTHGLLDVHSDALVAIQKAAADNNIDMPYPIQVVKVERTN